MEKNVTYNIGADGQCSKELEKRLKDLGLKGEIKLNRLRMVFKMSREGPVPGSARLAIYRHKKNTLLVLNGDGTATEIEAVRAGEHEFVNSPQKEEPASTNHRPIKVGTEKTGETTYLQEIGYAEFLEHFKPNIKDKNNAEAIAQAYLKANIITSDTSNPEIEQMVNARRKWGGWLLDAFALREPTEERKNEKRRLRAEGRAELHKLTITCKETLATATSMYENDPIQKRTVRKKATQTAQSRGATKNPSTRAK